MYVVCVEVVEVEIGVNLEIVFVIDDDWYC